jgi:hypothetical protein
MLRYEETVPFTFPITQGHVVKVYDGDTITIAAKMPYNYESPLYRFPVRLNGIDTAEIKGKTPDEKEAARIAKTELQTLLLHKDVVLKNILILFMNEYTKQVNAVMEDDNRQEFNTFITNPLALRDLLWPSVVFYKKQQEVIFSFVDNDETFVPAGNMLGKDFVSGFLILWFFLTRRPCRIVTTSAKDDHLRVLWGEINQFISTSQIPLTSDKGGPLLVNHQDIRWVNSDGSKCPKSYITGLVASPGSIAAMQGHHIAVTGDGIPRTAFVSDESSSVLDDYYKMAKTWMNRSLVIGNTWDCDNFFKHAIKGKPGTKDIGGDIKAEDGNRYYRKIIKITAEDSPNVRYGLAQKAKGITPTNEVLVPGVKSYGEYVKNSLMWDEIQKTVSLYAEFYEGKGVKLYPIEWLMLSRQYAIKIRGLKRKCKAIGIDTAEGGDKTSMCAIDEYGIIELTARKTPNTNDIYNEAMMFMIKHNCFGRNVGFDRGGGGKQHADRLRANGQKVRTIGFGEKIAQIPRQWKLQVREKIHVRETRYAYATRRAQLYGMLREILEPSPSGEVLFGIDYEELLTQMKPIPLQYDSEGSLRVPPKHKKNPNDKTITLIDLIGHSPDELDSLAIALHIMITKDDIATAGTF